jgi:thiol-disulfide isomerase/thioredoxin
VVARKRNPPEATEVGNGWFDGYRATGHASSAYPMKTKTPWLVAWLAFACTLSGVARAAAEKTAVKFSPPDFAAASVAAKQEAKLIFIDFYTTWCEPCKRLDAETWTDASVGKLIGDRAIALKIDAEKEGKDLAKRYKIDAYPTLLLLKADGSEVDRHVGYVNAADFKVAFTKFLALAEAGKTAVAQAKEEVAQADADEAQPHFDLAQKLAKAGQSEEALKELLWCWDEGKKDPEFARMARANRVPAALASLARTYPPAQEALVARRDQAKERVLANKGGTTMAQDLIQLNQALRSEEDTLAVFDKIPEADRRRVTFSIYLFNLLVEKQRYPDAVLSYMPQSAGMMLDRGRVQQMTARGGDEAAKSFLRFTVERTAKQIEALAGANRKEDAQDLIQKLLAFDGSEETKAVLKERLKRAGHPELAEAK